MAIVMEMQSAQITELTNYDFLSEIRFGGNGDEYLSPVYAISDSGGDEAAGYKMWDTNTANGIDSGWQTVVLTAQAGSNGVTWYLQGGDGTLAYTDTVFNTIDKIQIRAAVTNQASMQWRNIDVDFYRNGVAGDSYDEADGPAVDQTSNTTPSAMEDILTITPNTANYYNKVTVTAQVKMTAPAGVDLGESDIFGQVLVYA